MALRSAKELAMYLERMVPDYIRPKLSLEQYKSPAELAARIAMLASLRGELQDLVADLGAGTGMLSYALALCEAYYVIGLEVDVEALYQALRSPLWQNLANIDFVCCDALRPPLRRASLVVMNPPFGIRSSKFSDVDFVESAFKLGARTIYSIHAYNERSLELLERLARTNGYGLRLEMRMPIALKQMYEHHYKRVHRVEVMVLYFFSGGRAGVTS